MYNLMVWRNIHINIMFDYVVAYFVIFIIIYIWLIQYKDYELETIQLDEAIKYMRTGDLILFKAYNNFNSVLTGMYYGHIGIVNIGEDGVPMLFEANRITNMNLLASQPQSGLFYTPLHKRLQKYKGRMYWKRLSGDEFDQEIILGFESFIHYALDNMQYCNNVFCDAIKKVCGEYCGHDTNCGQLTFMSLIKLGLIDQDLYDKPIFRHLKWVYSLTDLEGGYSYEPLIEIIDHPF